MDPTEHFTVPGGYVVDIYDEPVILDRKRFEQYILKGYMPEPGVSKMLAVPFTVVDDEDDEQGMFTYFTSEQGGHYMVAGGQTSQKMKERLERFGAVKAIMSTMRERFNLSIPDEVKPSMDDILDKISRDGIDSLTDIERRLMQSGYNEKKKNNMEKFVPLFEEFVNDEKIKSRLDAAGLYGRVQRMIDAGTAHVDDIFDIALDLITAEGVDLNDNDDAQFDAEGEIETLLGNAGVQIDSGMSQGGDQIYRGVDEKWSGDAKIKQTGEYSGKSIEELEKMKGSLMKKKDRTDAETKKVRQINFAIRAKRNWKGDAKK